jgi:hypothetical protein
MISKYKRLPPEWKNFCVFTGKSYPDDALNWEHFILLSLGGNNSTKVRACKSINAKFNQEIDAPISNDPIVMFGRRDGKMFGQHGTSPVPKLNNARAWRKGDAWRSGEPRYRLEHPGGPSRVLDVKSRQYLPDSVFHDTAFAVELEVNHPAQCKFLLKSFVGMSWKLFGPDLLECIDVDVIRKVIGAIPSADDEKARQTDIYYASSTLARTEAEQNAIAKLQKIVVQYPQTRMLLSETQNRLGWAVACAGVLLGHVSIPIQRKMLGGEINDENGFLLTLGRGSFSAEIVSLV